MAISPAQLSTALTASGLPTPSTHFLTTILSSQRTQPPLPALVATAKHRLLTSDICSNSSSEGGVLASETAGLPADVSSPAVRERRLAASIPVQVLAVEDLSRSRWEQLEAIEAQERGEMTKGREIIRVVEAGDGEPVAGAPPPSSLSGSGGPHRLVLQDVKGRTAYALELKPVKGLGVGMSIGTKLMLCGVVVARGLLLLEPETVVVLGGKIDSLHKHWLENRKADLLAVIEGQT